VLATLADVGVATKYGHSEVGAVWGEDGVLMEQQEVEFLPGGLADMAETVAVAKWVVRNVCGKYGVSVSFSPKVALEHVGSGMHVHLCVLRNGVNVVGDGDGGLSADGLKVIGGLLKFARGLSAFGNTVPVSYLRFAARKESPMHVCWSGRNRLALVRVPLWWSFKRGSAGGGGCRETLEFRGPDALANAYLLFAGLALAVEYGLTNSQEVLRIAEVLHVGEGGRGRRGVLKSLPLSCGEAAGFLLRDRRFYEAGGVFPKVLVDKTVERLRAYGDGELLRGLAGKPAKAESVLKQYLHCG
jgi:glutamine synthetase